MGSLGSPFWPWFNSHHFGKKSPLVSAFATLRKSLTESSFSVNNNYYIYVIVWYTYNHYCYYFYFNNVTIITIIYSLPTMYQTLLWDTLYIFFLVQEIAEIWAFWLHFYKWGNWGSRDERPCPRSHMLGDEGRSRRKSARVGTDHWTRSFETVGMTSLSHDCNPARLLVGVGREVRGARWAEQESGRN